MRSAGGVRLSWSAEPPSGVADLHLVGERYPLAAEDVPLVEVLLLEDLVAQHLDLAVVDDAGAGAAQPLAARVGRLEPLLQQEVEQPLAARPVELVGLAVELHLEAGQLAVDVGRLDREGQLE